MSLLLVATLRAESWALIRVLRSARLRHVSLTWLLSPLLARDTSDRPAVIFQPSDSYTCAVLPTSFWKNPELYSKKSENFYRTILNIQRNRSKNPNTRKIGIKRDLQNPYCSDKIRNFGSTACGAIPLEHRHVPYYYKFLRV